jgi:hypothetical protein
VGPGAAGPGAAGPDAPSAEPANPAASSPTGAALFDPPPAAPAPAAPEPTGPAPGSSEDALGDQGISAQLGLVTGGRVTPGGLRVAGHYLYQLSDDDWFDGAAGFTFGSGRAACFRDRQDALVCKHGLADGTGVEISARIRRQLAPHGPFQPFALVGLGLGLARFAGDDLSGFVVVAHAGGGVRVAVAPSVAVLIEDQLELGVGGFGRGLGLQPQIGFAITAGAEFRLR